MIKRVLAVSLMGLFSLLACAPAQANSVTIAKLNRFIKPPLHVVAC